MDPDRKQDQDPDSRLTNLKGLIIFIETINTTHGTWY